MSRRLVITHNFDDLSAAFSDLARNHKARIVSRGINDTARFASTMARRLVATKGGFRHGYVRQHMQLKLSSAADLYADIRGRSRYSLVTQFRPSIGANRRLRGASPWNTRRSFRGRAFMIRSRSGNEVPVVRGSRGIKALYGPSVARELERNYVRRPVEQEVGTRLPARTTHYAGVYMRQLKGRYGL